MSASPLVTKDRLLGYLANPKICPRIIHDKNAEMSRRNDVGARSQTEFESILLTVVEFESVLIEWIVDVSISLRCVPVLT